MNWSQVPNLAKAVVTVRNTFEVVSAPSIDVEMLIRILIVGDLLP
jgi:hypothetical protein